MEYRKPQITDLGSIVRHTFWTNTQGGFKGFLNDNGDADCELSHSGDANPNESPGLCEN